MSVFFISSCAIHDTSLTIQGPLFNHIHKSLRVHEGDELVVGDEQRRRYHTRVTKVWKNSLDCEILHAEQGPPAQPAQLIIGQAILKGEHMTWVIQKATELGVSTITPLLTDRVVVRPPTSRLNALRERWQRIAVDAAQQSERWDIPEVITPSSLPEFLGTNGSGDIRCILVERDAAQGLHTLPVNEHFKGKIIVTVGPEGGWTTEELEEAQRCHFTSISLGPLILRGETAPLVALSILQSHLGNLG